MVKHYFIASGQMIPGDAERAEVSMYFRPDAAERRLLEDVCSISSHNISSALDPDEIGRVEYEDNHWAMILKTPINYSSSDNYLFKVTSLGIFFYGDKLILISSVEDDTILDTRQNIKIQSLHDVLLKIFFGTVNHYLGHLKVINLISDSLEEKVNASMANEHLLNMFTIEKSLVYYLNGINSNLIVFDKVKALNKKIGMSEENAELLDDLIIENQQCNKQAEIYSNILTGLMDARGSIVNNNLSLLIKRLTVISIVFMPLNIIAGMGGMSEYGVWLKESVGIKESWMLVGGYVLFGIGLFGVAILVYWILTLFGIDTSTGSSKKKKARR